MMVEKNLTTTSRNNKTPPCEGIFGVYKPCGITSQRVVQIVKQWVRKETAITKIKVGHAGTLDPLASGVLVVGVGKEYTKKLDTAQSAQKKYHAHVKLGVTSTTDDREGQKVVSVPPRHTLGIEDMQGAVKKFIGTVGQVPPLYSAIKIDGQEAYKRARRGERITMKPRQVNILDIKIVSYVYPDLVLVVKCSKGTYIRSLARDIGAAVGAGGYLSALERTEVGPYNTDSSYALSRFVTTPLYCVTGTVMVGKRHGTELGFPTANVALKEKQGRGIYAGRVFYKGKSYEAALYVGMGQNMVEAHLLDFYGVLYDQEIKIEAFLKLRDDQDFLQREDLVAQISKDIEGVVQFFHGTTHV